MTEHGGTGKQAKSSDLLPLPAPQRECAPLPDVDMGQNRPEMPPDCVSLDFPIVGMGKGNQRRKTQICGGVARWSDSVFWDVRIPRAP